jgi:predicted Zn-dependent protease
MKKSITVIILATILLLFLSSHGKKLKYKLVKVNSKQTQIKFKTATIEVDNELLEYTIEFIEEAYKHDINVEMVSRSYMGIYCDETPFGMVGITDLNFPHYSYSLINCENIQSNNRLRAVIFHELGHKYVTWGHCHAYCDQIMSSVMNDRMVYGDWSKQKEIFFKNIKHDGIILPKKE